MVSADARTISCERIIYNLKYYSILTATPTVMPGEGRASTTWNAANEDVDARDKA
jgi:hypothetical protein